MDVDEGPSPEDIVRFSSSEAYCPSCGNEIWDEAPKCPSCGEWIDGRTDVRPRQAAEVRRKLFVLVALLLAFLLGGGFVVLRIF